MTKEFLAQRLQNIKEAHQRFLKRKAKELSELEDTEVVDLFDGIQTLTIGDKENE